MQIAVLALALLLAAPGLSFAQPPGSRVVLDVPPRYTAATRFSGYLDEPRGISIVIAELPGVAFDQIATGMTPGALATQKMTQSKRGTLARTGDYVYLTAEQTQAGTTYGKFLLVTRENDVPAIVTVNVPKERLTAGDATAAEFEAILASARVAGTAAAEKPLFTLGYLGPFKRAGSFGGSATLYTPDGVITPATPEPGRPMFLVAPSIDERPVGDLEAFARRALEGTRGFSDLTVTATRPLTIGALRAVELTATASEASQHTDVAIVQTVVVLSGGGYVRMMGQSSAADWARLLPEFRRMAESFTPAP